MQASSPRHPTKHSPPVCLLFAVPFLPLRKRLPAPLPCLCTLSLLPLPFPEPTSPSHLELLQTPDTDIPLRLGQVQSQGAWTSQGQMPPFWWLPEGGGRLSIPGGTPVAPAPSVWTSSLDMYICVLKSPLMLEQSWSQGSPVGSNVPLSTKTHPLCKEATGPGSRNS